MKLPRIHRSTKIVFGVVMLCFLVLPITLLVRNYGRPPEPDWLTYLMSTHKVFGFQFSALITDALLVMTISFVLAALWEFNVRRHEQAVQSGKRTWLLPLATLAVLAAICGYFFGGAIKQSLAIRRLENSGGVVKVNVTPTRFHAFYELIDPRMEGTPQVMSLQGCDLRDESLLSADALQGLENLMIRDSQLSDGTYAALGNLKKLYALGVVRTQPGVVLEAQQLQAMSNLKGLRWLSLSGLDVSELDLQVLGNMKSLSDLGLQNSNVVDSQLDAVAQLPGLNRLELGGTPITDDGLMRLVNCKLLYYIQVKGTSITKDAMEKFNQARPNQRIVWEH
jgi:hypothetical protein